MSIQPYEQIAKILRADKHDLLKMEEQLLSLTGKKDIYASIVAENAKIIADRLSVLGVSAGSSAKEVYDALISRIESDDYQLFKALGNPNCQRVEDCQIIADTAYKAAKPPKGFFLKHEKAREFLMKEPPMQVMGFLGYTTAEEMLAKEDLLEVYSALRFIEGSEWLNSVFFKQYTSLTPDDFEEREVVVHVLGEKWAKESQQFVAKKKHNISHLKELGVVFVIPTLLGISGEILRMFALIMHYLHEVPFYSRLFEDNIQDPSTFAEHLISLLRGDVLEGRFNGTDTLQWLVVQRYLAKEDENDWRLFVPHINPEALHWTRAINNFVDVGEILGGLSHELGFWKDLGWIGDYFKDESGVEVLVSFDLVDTVMSLVKQKEMVKYLYHHEEALWNKIFTEYFGEQALEAYSRKYLLQGYFEV